MHQRCMTLEVEPRSCRKKDFFRFSPEEILLHIPIFHSLLQASFTSALVFPLISKELIEKVLHISVILALILLLIF